MLLKCECSVYSWLNHSCYLWIFEFYSSRRQGSKKIVPKGWLMVRRRERGGVGLSMSSVPAHSPYVQSSSTSNMAGWIKVHKLMPLTCPKELSHMFQSKETRTAILTDAIAYNQHTMIQRFWITENLPWVSNSP